MLLIIFTSGIFYGSSSIVRFIIFDEKSSVKIFSFYVLYIEIYDERNSTRNFIDHIDLMDITHICGVYPTRSSEVLYASSINRGDGFSVFVLLVLYCEESPNLYWIKWNTDCFFLSERAYEGIKSSYIVILLCIECTNNSLVKTWIGSLYF